MNKRGEEKVSVIIPFYNTEKYLRRCVESIAGQSYTNLEIILVDDGSLDGSALLAEKMAENDIRIHLLRTNHTGVSAARNAGLANASGRFILFVDSDDWMTPDIIECMVKQMSQTDADLVTCELAFSDGTEYSQQAAEKTKAGYDRAGETSSNRSTEIRIFTREEYLRLFFRIDSNEWVHFPVAKLYKKELLPQPLYPEGIQIGEDVLGTYQALLSVGKIVQICEVGYYYFKNPQSASIHFTEKDFDLLKVWDQVVAITEGREPDHSYAQINRDRVNFTLLFRMITEVPASEIRIKYSVQLRQLRNDLSACEKRLLQSPIIRSRKILIRLLCHGYPFMAVAGNIYVELNRARGKAPGLTRRKLS